MTEPTKAPEEKAKTTATPVDAPGVVEPRWVVRIDFVASNRGKVVMRVSDATDLQDAVRIAMAQVEHEYDGPKVTRVEAFEPSRKTLVPRSAFG